MKPADHPRTAMVLAAGLGTRMRPLTDSRPKPLVEVAGRPLIGHVLERLAEAGVERAVVNVHYRAEQIEAYLKTRDGGPETTVSDERDQLLETGGGVKKALPLLGEGPFFITNTDSIWIEGAHSLIGRLAAAWKPDAMDALLVVAATVNASGYSGRGDFLVTPDGRIERRPERELAPFVYTGMGILSPRLFEDAPDGPFSLNVLFDRAIEDNRLYAMRMDGPWIHVGTPEAVGEAERVIQQSVL